MKAVTALALVASLAACGDVGTVLDRYGSVRAVPFQHDGATWRIFDKPEERRLMITPTIGAAMAAGASAGVTLGASGDGIAPNNQFSAAATAWIQRHGSSCRVTDGRELVKTQYEFDYAC